MSIRSLRVLFLVATVPVASLVMQACGETDDDPPPVTTDASAKLPDSSTLDTGAGDTATPPVDSSTNDAGPADSAADAKDASVDAFDAGPCLVGIDDTVSATLKMTADDYLRVYVNGVLVDDKNSTWNTIGNYTISLHRHPSRTNVIAVDARNAFSQGGLDRGLIADLSFNLSPDGGVIDAGADADAGDGTQHIVTDTSWKLLAAPDGGVPDGGMADAGILGWFDPAFDASTWVAATDEGAHGIAPWGVVFGTSTARWLWGYDSGTAITKPVSETFYFRKTFSFSAAGTVLDAPGSCP